MDRQYQIKDTYSVSTETWQIVNGKIQCQYNVTTPMCSAGNIRESYGYNYTGLLLKFFVSKPIDTENVFKCSRLLSPEI